MTSEQVAKVMRILVESGEIWMSGYEGMLVDCGNKSEIMDYLESLVEYLEDNDGYCALLDRESYDYMQDELRRFL